MGLLLFITLENKIKMHEQNPRKLKEENEL